MFFSEIEQGGHFFFVGSNIPITKSGPKTFVEGGSAVHRQAGGGERVVPITFGRNAEGHVSSVKIGHYTVPLPQSQPGPEIESTGDES